MDQVTSQISRQVSRLSSDVTSLQQSMSRQLNGLGRDVQQAGAYAQSADQSIKAVQKSFEGLYHLLHRQFQEIATRLEALEQLPYLFRHLEEVLQTQFELSFTHQLEAHVIAHQGRIVANRMRTEVLEQFLKEKHAQFEKAYLELRERYQKLLQELAQQNVERRRQLDSHAYELLEKVYPERVQSKFSFMSLPAYSYLAAHASESAVARSAGLEDKYEEARAAIVDHQQRRERFQADAREWFADAVQPGPYVLRAWVVEVENEKTGARRTMVRFPGAADFEPELAAQLRSVVKERLGAGEVTDLPEDARELLSRSLEERGVPASEVQRFCSHAVRFIAA